MRKIILAGCFIAVVLSLGTVTWFKFADATGWNVPSRPADDAVDENEPSIPQPVSATPADMAAEPNDPSGLGGYDVLIADRGNNRLLEVTPQKKIVWLYQFYLPQNGLGADDSFFTDSGHTIVVNLEEYQMIQQIDYASKQVVWSYGMPGKSGSGAGFLHTPDDAYKLPNGDVIVADISNCRVMEISPDKKILHQYGVTKKCRNVTGYLDKPNGDTPLPNGHILISNIWSDKLIELNERWQPIFTMKLPVVYPSDPQMTRSGNILIADYSNPGKIVEVSKKGKIVWEYGVKKGQNLNRPSLAVELPNGNILANDDLNHRVIVIDKKTQQITWQYGITGKPGSGSGQLNTPDGLDIIMRTPAFVSGAINLPAQSNQDNPSASLLPLHTIGQVTRHATNFIGQLVRMKGYPIQSGSGYVIFSDEANGGVGRFDLPVTGSGINTIHMKESYILEGTFLNQGLFASNHNPDHLQLEAAPLLRP